MSEYGKGNGIHVYDFDKCIAALRQRHDDQEIQDKLNRMTKEYNRGFPISEDEQKAIDKWKVKHKAEVHSAVTSNHRSEFECVCGGNYLYQFIPTSIGVAGVITCSCGAKFEFQHIGI